MRANLEAWHSDLKAAIGEGFAIYPEHNLHMLLYAASYDGQGAIAMRAGKDYTKLTGESFYEVLTLIRFGRFDEVLRGHQPAEDRRSRARSGTSRRATRTSNRARRLRAALSRRASRRRPTPRRRCSASTPAKNLLSIVAGILEGEIQRTGGESATARSRRSSGRPSMQDALVYDEPEPLPFAARHWLGAALLEAKRFADAEKVYRAELKDHPHNGWSLLGLQQALAAKGTPSPQVDADLAASWARADTWIRRSRF